MCKGRAASATVRGHAFPLMSPHMFPVRLSEWLSNSLRLGAVREEGMKRHISLDMCWELHFWDCKGQVKKHRAPTAANL